MKPQGNNDSDKQNNEEIRKKSINSLLKLVKVIDQFKCHHITLDEFMYEYEGLEYIDEYIGIDADYLDELWCDFTNSEILNELESKMELCIHRIRDLDYKAQSLCQEIECSFLSQIKTIKQAADAYEGHMNRVFPAPPYTARVSVEDVLGAQKIKADLVKSLSECVEAEEELLRLRNKINSIKARYDKLNQRSNEIRNHVDVEYSYNDRLKKQAEITLLIDEIRGEAVNILRKKHGSSDY